MLSRRKNQELFNAIYKNDYNGAVNSINQGASKCQRVSHR